MKSAIDMAKSGRVLLHIWMQVGPRVYRQCLESEGAREAMGVGTLAVLLLGVAAKRDPELRNRRHLDFLKAGEIVRGRQNWCQNTVSGAHSSKTIASDLLLVSKHCFGRFLVPPLM